MAARKPTQTVQLTVRMKEPLRAALELAAKGREVSLNAEVIERLERSFEHEQRISDAFGDQRIYAIMRMIGAALDSFRKPNQERPAWLDDPIDFDIMAATVIKLLTMFRPADIDDPHGWGASVARVAPEFMGPQVLDEVPDRVRDALGSELRERIDSHRAATKTDGQRRRQKAKKPA